MLYTTKKISVQEIKANDILSALPEPIECSNIEYCPDLFICAAGFEERSHHIINQLNLLNSKQNLTCSIIARYPESISQENTRSYNEILSIAKQFSSTCVSPNAEDEIEVMNSIKSFFKDNKSQENVVIYFDISTASHVLILSVMKSLEEFSQKINLTVLYVEASSYFPPEPINDEARNQLINELNHDDYTEMEMGILEAEYMELFPGITHENRIQISIFMPNFRTNRISRCIDKIGEELLLSETENVFWIFGMPYHENLQWRNTLQKDVIISMLDKMTPDSSGQLAQNHLKNSFNLSTINYKETLEKLITLSDENIGAKIDLIPFGAKMQIFGASLALLIRKEIGVLSAQPKKFSAKSYSIGIGKCWKIEFQQFEQALISLKKIGTVKIETQAY